MSAPFSPEVRRGGGLPFGQVVSRWVCDPRYTTNLRTLYTILVTYADIGARDTGKGKPYRPELAAQLGVSVKTLDRTLMEGECAGLFWIEKRTDPNNPKLNDASVYHLRDAEFWRGEWTDPLAPGQTAAEAAAAVVAARVEEKRAAGIKPKGGRKKKPTTATTEGVASPMSPPPDPGGSVTHDATPSVTHDATLASPMTPNIKIPVENPCREPDHLRPSVPAGGDARAVPADGGTDGRGGGGIEEQERGRPSAGGEPGPAAAGAAPGTDAAATGAGDAPAAGRVPVVMTPGVEVLRAVAAEAAEWTVTGDTLRDQGLVVTGMLAAGFTAQEVRHALLSRPLPDKLTHTVGAVIGRRLRDLLAAGPAGAVQPIPEQTARARRGGPDDGPKTDLSTAAGVSWAERQRQLSAATSGLAPVRDCAGDDGMCHRLAVPGEEFCATCLGWPPCARTCGRRVPTEGMLCPTCEMTLGYEREAAGERARRASDAGLNAALTEAAAAVAAEETSPAPF
ncbi:hypothetical protein ACFXCZ_35410 [Streptomyces sp. NPDC059396]|uniref:hypothetical protein n=1 Tax=Streptomyces sp. NPDC059396 TaxID=3346819 RepID=UPI0036A94EB5